MDHMLFFLTKRLFLITLAFNVYFESRNIVQNTFKLEVHPKVASQFDRRSFRSKPKVSSIEDKSQFDRRVNDYKNYSFASV